ncbi:MAG: immunoglobulin domain-containing protein [Verrucomicrobia bacterium]|nr:immunoglobulin domain-containing protein [Verrucomicrobiota bacterium]
MGQPQPVITVHPQNTDACVGSNAIFYVEVTGNPPMSFQWYTNGVFVPAGVVSSQTNSFLTLDNVQFEDSGMTVEVWINNPFGYTNSTQVFLHVPDPHICEQPVSTAVPVGGIISFHVSAAGSEPLMYQWWFLRTGLPNATPLTNSARVDGATNSHLFITNATGSDAGTYWVAVTNWFYVGVTSAPVQCAVGLPPAASNPGSRIVNVFKSTTFIPTYSGTLPRAYQWFRNDNPVLNATNTQLTLTNIQRPEVGLYHVLVSNAFGTATSPQAHLQVRLTLEGTSPVFREEATDVLDGLTNAVPSLVLPATTVLHGVPLLFSTYNATASAGEASRCGVPATHSLWILYTSPRTEVTRVSTEGSDFDTVAAVYSWNGNPGSAPTQLMCDNDSGYDGADSVLFFPAATGQNYYVAVDGVSGATGTARLQVGENIRKFSYNRTNGTFRFELAGPFWYENSLRSASNLTLPSGWPAILTMPATNKDWIIGYTNTSAAADAARFYTVNVNTNSAP